MIAAPVSMNMRTIRSAKFTWRRKTHVELKACVSIFASWTGTPERRVRRGTLQHVVGAEFADPCPDMDREDHEAGRDASDEEFSDSQLRVNADDAHRDRWRNDDDFGERPLSKGYKGFAIAATSLIAMTQQDATDVWQDCAAWSGSRGCPWITWRGQFDRISARTGRDRRRLTQADGP